jgi:hypothetical protein
VQSALYYDAEPVLWSQGVFGLSGGSWWMARDVPPRLVAKLPHVPGMVPSEWHKADRTIPRDIEQYFTEHI